MAITDLAEYPDTAPPGTPAAGLRKQTLALGFTLARTSGTGTPLAWARYIDNPQAWRGHSPENCTETCENTHTTPAPAARMHQPDTWTQATTSPERTERTIMPLTDHDTAADLSATAADIAAAIADGRAPAPADLEHARDMLDTLEAVLGHPAGRPTVVCLCGSTRFYDQFQQANYDLTMRGEIVLSVGFYPHAADRHGHGEGVGHDSAAKTALDELHKRKIDLADYVLVISPGGYIGESTRSEIDYATAHGKPVRYLTADDGDQTGPLFDAAPYRRNPR